MRKLRKDALTLAEFIHTMSAAYRVVRGSGKLVRARHLFFHCIGSSCYQRSVSARNSTEQRLTGDGRRPVRTDLSRTPGADHVTSIQRSAAAGALLSGLGLGPLPSYEQRGIYRSGTKRTIDLALHLLDDRLLIDWLFQSRDHRGLPPCEWTINFRPGFRKIVYGFKFPFQPRHTFWHSRADVRRAHNCPPVRSGPACAGTVREFVG